MRSNDDPQLPPYLWLVPHTHWDREWYEPHDVFRARLVAMLDELLLTLEAEPEYRFTLDGQAAAIADYLEIRPEEEVRVRAAVERGQLVLGPFQILLDEFCCDGETIVRNLERGIREARKFGPELRVGYLPDMFGHAAQMPQLLRGFGIVDASLWRGAPGEVGVHAFVWEALNGDAVRVEYQWDGYGSALKLFDPVAAAPQRVTEYVRENAAWFRGEPVAGMFGTDHMAPRRDLVEIVRAYNATGHAIPLRIGTIGDVIAARDHSPEGLAGLPIVAGEMRSHARGNLLPGVFSIRTGMKAAMAGAERALTTAERLDAVLGGRDRRAFCERGWGLAIESTAHDSVTGCGADATAAEVESRLRVAEQTARGAIDIALADLAARAPVGSLAVFNQAGVERVALAEMTVEGPLQALPPGCQAVGALPTVIGDELIASGDLQKIVRRIHGQEYFGKQLRGWSWDEDELVFEVAEMAVRESGSAAGHIPASAFGLADFVATLRAKAAQSPAKLWRVRCVAHESHRVLVAGRTAGLGIAELSPQISAPIGECANVDGHVLTNGLVRAAVRADGLVDILHVDSGARIAGALRLVDEGDRGDSYNFGPTEGGMVATPEAIAIETLEAGPLRAIVKIRRTFALPAGLDGEERSRRSAGVVGQVVDTFLELRTGEEFLRVSVRLVNAAKDHRLRVLVPTREVRLEGSASAGQYGVTERGRTAEGGWGEYPLPTFPAYRWVHAGGVAALLRQLTEYEIVPDDERDALALTILRAVGLMSVNVHPLRDEPAGSEVPVPGAQYLGREVRCDFAIDLSAPQWDGPSLVANSERFRFDPVAVVGTLDPGALSLRHPARSRWMQDASRDVRTLGLGSDALLRSAPDDVAGEGLAANANAGAVVLESLRRVEGGVEARLVNYSRAPQPLRVRASDEWWLTDMAGTELAGPIDTWEHVVPAGTIVTLRTRAHS